MMNRVRFSAVVVVCACGAALGQAVTRTVVLDGDAAPGFAGSSIDLIFSDQSMVNSLPQLTADGTVTFRGRVVSAVGGVTSNDTWWLTSEGSYQNAAYISGTPGILQVPTGQFGRLYAFPMAERTLMDRSGGRMFQWQNQRWIAGWGTAGWTTTLDGLPWFPTQMDRSTALMARPDQLVMSVMVPIPPGSPQAGPGPGFVAGWNGVYRSIIATGQQVAGQPGAYFVVPENIGGSNDTALGRTMRINASDQWVARVGFGGEGVTGLNNHAIYRGTIGGAMVQVIRANDTAPGWPAAQGARIGALSRPSINGQGHIAFVARTVTNSPSSGQFFSLYVDRGNGLELLAHTGDAVAPAVATTPAPTINYPWMPTGNQPAAPVIGEDGAVAFVASLSAGEAVLVHHNGVVHEAVRRDMVLPRTGGRMVARTFSLASAFEGATGLAIAANGDVVFSVPATGNYDPRLATTGTVRAAVLAWRPGRGVRVVSCQGMAFDDLPGMRNRIYGSSLLGDGNGNDGVPTGLGQGASAALQIDFVRFNTDGSPAFQAVVVADLDTFACGVADVGRAGAEPLADGVLDNNDFIVMIDRFFNGDLRADYGSRGGVIGFDDALDNNDFVAFIDLFFAGCP